MRYRTAVTLFIGLIFAITGLAYISNKEKHREPASVKSKFWMPVPVGKHLALVKVEVASSEIPSSGNDEVHLIGRILVNQEMTGDLSYEWSVPEDVQVVEGHLSDSYANVKMGQIVEVKLTVSGFNKEKQRTISLQAYGARGEEKMGNSAVVVSRPEDTWESVASEMKKAADEQLGSESKTVGR
ncbi:MAG: hypothetical protein OM95_08245 [Bdellovibrio sp. ArHS]|uniref:hypothetical protein n=1 Tax=Bdellovibrio sp. ArHS TaxID=1569284 RepID=UPI0005826DAB|nr:hypothetical protein [Bdellovibrio sp. ArHS]KHD88493.1 MAG: hypothetical protein OM95_08245 [Bdellovibrio sp. ArHS]